MHILANAQLQCNFSSYMNTNAHTFGRASVVMSMGLGRMFVEQSRMFVCACPEQGKLSMIAFKCNLAARSVPRHMMHDERVCLRACDWIWMPLDGYVVGKVVEVDDVKLVSLSASSLCWFIYRKTTRAFLRLRIRAQWHWDFFV